VSQLLYASPVWWGYLKVDERNRLQSIIVKASVVVKDLRLKDEDKDKESSFKDKDKDEDLSFEDKDKDLGRH